MQTNYGSKKKKRFVLPLVIFVLVLASLGAYYFLNSQAIIFRLNEMGWRYDTFTVSFEHAIPESLADEIAFELNQVVDEDRQRFEIVEEGGDISLGVVRDGGIYEDFLIPVGHFYWIDNAVERDDLTTREILVEEGYEALFSEILDSDDINEVDNLLSALEDKESEAVGFVDLENLDYTYQLLYMDDSYFLEDFDGVLHWGVDVQSANAPEFVVDIVEEKLAELNPDFEEDEVGKINVSGVTALSRNLAAKIEGAGYYDYPAEFIGDFLSDADVVHTSNEVSFVPGCKPEASMRFCANPNYIKTLESAGINVVELTGNHNNDFGAEYNSETIEMYKERGWGYYGGGLNEEDAAEILYLDVQGTKVAFIGYNYYDSIYEFVHNLAVGDRAGANSFSFEKMEQDIQEARAEGALPIVTFQFQECYSYPPSDVIYPPCYKPLSNPDQQEVFRRAVDYGAEIVIGSQAHQPQTYEIYDGRLIFYGTGNLFFDQIQWIGTRQGMILSHYVYDGRVLQSKITTTLYDDDMRPYVTSGEDRELLLSLLRDARE